MNKSFATVLAGATGALIVAGSASAGFVGLTFTKKHDDAGLILSDGTPVWVTNIAARFDDPGDRVLSVHAQGRVLNASFYQNFFSTDLAPSTALFDAFPDIQWDSFVTIGKKVDDSVTEIGHDFDTKGFEGCRLSGTWVNSDPGSGQGDAGTYEDLSVLVAQLTHQNWSHSTKGFGTMTVTWQDGATGDVTATHVEYQTSLGGPHCSDLWDLDGNEHVGPEDLAILLGSWGPTDGCGTAGQGDFDIDGVVGPADLAELLGHWGPCRF